jgi:hypothetical protein
MDPKNISEDKSQAMHKQPKVQLQPQLACTKCLFPLQTKNWREIQSSEQGHQKHTNPFFVN